MTAMPAVTEKKTRLSPWVSLLEVCVGKSKPQNEVWYGMQVPDYAGVVAVTPTGNLVLVQQYRPISGKFTWEFPGELCEKEENALETATRELYEESGCHLLEGVVMGATLADTGRLRANVHHVFACVSEQDATWQAEEGITVAVMPLQGLVEKVLQNQFQHGAYVGSLFFALNHPAVGEICKKHQVPNPFQQLATQLVGRSA